MKNLTKLTYALTILVALATPTIAVAADNYGAIAFSQTTSASGWSKNFTSQSEAEATALQYCKENNSAGDCRIAYSFVNSCGALAVGGDNGWGADWGAEAVAAENKALHTCAGYSYDCKVVVSQCSKGS